MKFEEKEALEKYNIIAKHYHDQRTKKYPGSWFYNELLEMPAAFELLGNIKNKKILDFGCGTGIYAKKLVKKGARVKGFDISPEMLNIAKKENPDLDLRQGSGYKIPFKEKFDIVIASLVLGYVKDWDIVFKEVKRVLKKGGHFIFSIHNPVTKITSNHGKNKMVRKFGNYFGGEKIYSSWEDIEHNGNKKVVEMPSYHRTYESIIKIILKNNFEIVGYKDTFPVKKAKKLFPEKYKFSSKAPYFCVWKVKKK